MTRPRFATTAAWQQAEVLMQPVFIRLVDNIRKELEQSSWEGRYQEDWVWPDGVTAETQAEVRRLREQLAIAPATETAALEASLAALPQPFPGYFLCLAHNGKMVSVDLWQLCYQICFKNYHPLLTQADSITADIDTALLDEAGEVDWQSLDTKAQAIVHQIFASLAPT